MPSVFISHSSKDRDFVERTIIAPLRQNGIDHWYSKDSIETAAEWEQKIKEGLKRCDWFLVAMSPNAVASKWVRLELFWALQKREGRVVPTMIQPCDPGELHLGLLPLQYIDFSEDLAQAQAKLVSVFESDKRNQIAELSATATAALADRDWVKAIANLESLIRVDPGNAKATEQLTHAQRQHQLETNYRDARKAIDAKRWQEAVQYLRNVRTIDKAYENASELFGEAADARVAELENKLQTLQKTAGPAEPVKPAAKVKPARGWIVATIVLALISFIFLIAWGAASESSRKATARATYAESRASGLSTDLENSQKELATYKTRDASNAQKDATIFIQNKSTFNIYSVWMATQAETTWGNDRLGSGKIAPGASSNFKIHPGSYQLKVKLSEWETPFFWSSENLLTSVPGNSQIVIEISNASDSTAMHPSIVRSVHPL